MWLLSRRSVLFVGVAVALALSPLPPPLLLVLGRVALALVAALAAARLLAPCLPALKVSGRQRRAVLVTGCSSGFGFETALALDKMGVPVLAACRNPEAQGVLELQKKASANLKVVKMDVASDESVYAAAQEVRGMLGDNKLWAVVNNAGVLPMGEALWMDDAAMRDAFEVNAFGHVRVVRAFLPLLRQARGRVVNVLTIICNFPAAGVTPYAMSKIASCTLSETIMLELKRFGVSVHIVQPALYKTRMTEDNPKVIRETWEKCPQSIKDMYVPDYGERFAKLVDRASMFFYPASQISTVSSAVIDACFALDPQSIYVPCFLGRLVVIGANICPWFVDLIHALVLPSIPKQQTSQNNV